MQRVWMRGSIVRANSRVLDDADALAREVGEPLALPRGLHAAVAHDEDRARSVTSVAS